MIHRLLDRDFREFVSRQVVPIQSVQRNRGDAEDAEVPQSIH